MYSKSGQDLSRYFSELVAAALALREKASSWTVKSWFRTAVNFHSIIFCNAFTRPPEIGRADAGSARVRPAEERQKAPGCVVSGHGAPNFPGASLFRLSPSSLKLKDAKRWLDSAVEEATA
jgi:hypothetical protein